MKKKLLIVAVIVLTVFFGWKRAPFASESDQNIDPSPTTGPGDAANAASQPASSPAEQTLNEPFQTWNLHLQNTEVVQGDPPFSAKYSGLRSLNSRGEAQETVSLDLFAGLRLWPGAEFHADGLMWQGFGLSKTNGVEAFTSAEAYKAGTTYPWLMFARLFIRQTIGLGGKQEGVADDQLTLAGEQDLSRLTFSLGRFSATDIFDRNTYADDPQTQFLNWAMVANLAWDYPADTVGFTTGFAAELNQANWALRYGFFQMPDEQNSNTGDDKFLMWRTAGAVGPAGNYGPFLHDWGMVVEFERRYSAYGSPGAIRFMPFLDEANMAGNHAAVSILQAEGPEANFAAAQSWRYKYGFGLNWEQAVVKNIGLFSRLGWNDGHEQAWQYTDVNWTASLGMRVAGEAWNRSHDTFGLAGVISGASSSNQRFLQLGGMGILAGDGALTYGSEKVMETYYDFPIWRTVHGAVDYQFISNPAFNRDRGPVSVFGGRLHWEL